MGLHTGFSLAVAIHIGLLLRMHMCKVKTSKIALVRLLICLSMKFCEAEENCFGLIVKL